jgi:hypothetical protein
MVTLFWIVFDVAITLRMAFVSPQYGIPIWECAIWGLVGLSLGIAAYVFERRERKSHNKTMTDLQAELTRQGAFNAGAFTVIGKTIVELPSLMPANPRIAQLEAELSAYRDRLAQIVWVPLAPEAKMQLRNGLSKLESGELRILHDGASDCEQLARELGQIFVDIGWALGRIKSMESEIGPTRGVRLHGGIDVSGGSNDLVVHAIRDILSGVLNVQVSAKVAFDKADRRVIFLWIGAKGQEGS